MYLTSGCRDYSYRWKGRHLASAVAHRAHSKRSLRRQSPRTQAQGRVCGWSREVTGHTNFQRHKGVTTATVDLEEQDIEEALPRDQQSQRAHRVAIDVPALLTTSDAHTFPGTVRDISAQAFPIEVTNAV